MFKLDIARHLESHPLADGGQHIGMRQGGTEELGIYLLLIGDHPHAAFALGLSAMSLPPTWFATMVGEHNDKPFFIVVFFAILYGFPNGFKLLVGDKNGTVGLSTIAVDMKRIVCVPKINPVEVGCIFLQALRGFSIAFCNLMYNS